MGKLERLVDSRFIQARLDKDAGRPIREFPAELFALDEAEILMDEARLRDDIKPPGRGQLSMQRNLARMLRKGLKLGRGLTKKKGKGLKVMYVAQSPLCSRLGLNRDDFDQSVNIFIGENIPRALEEELKGKVSAVDKAFWLEQYHLRVNRGDEFFCLVKMPGKRPFIATMPVPGMYGVNGIATSQLSEPEPVTGTVPDEALDTINLDSELNSSHPFAAFGFDRFEDYPTGEFDLTLPYLNNLPADEVARLMQGLDPNAAEDGFPEDLKPASDQSLNQVEEVSSPDLEWQPDQDEQAYLDNTASDASSDQLEEVGEVEEVREDGEDLLQFDPKNADQTSSNQSSPSPFIEETAFEPVLPWSATANPVKLFGSARSQMVQLIEQGYTKPFEICTAIWGNVVNPHAKPYNGKAGVKVLVEKLIKQVNP